jgi:uncharacterized repeat protein (TIGR03803 family)
MKTISITAVLFTLSTLMLTAQTFTPLHYFANSPGDGAYPQGSLIQGPDGTLYGTTWGGGTNNLGTVFKINPDGSGYRVLWSLPGSPGPETPYAGLVLGSNTLYGTSYNGGTNHNGTIFEVNTDGSNPQIVFNINAANNDGANPISRLALGGNTLYGTTPISGNGAGDGLVYSVNTGGGNFQQLKFFGTPGVNDSDGYTPEAGLLLAGNILYGTTSAGGNGSTNSGTVFKINPGGTGFNVITRFVGTAATVPSSDLIINGSTLYGTTQSATNNGGGGTVFKVNTDGSGLQILHIFANGLPNDGAFPSGPLVLSGNTLYGTTRGGQGTGQNGTVFAVNTDGSGFTLVHTFSPDGLNADGTSPYGGLVVGGGQLYGTANSGGTSDHGVIFSINFRSAIPTNLVYNADGSFSLSYLLGTNYLGTNYSYVLQASTNLNSGSWQPLATNFATINLWQFTDTNSKSLPMRFYRVAEY